MNALHVKTLAYGRQAAATFMLAMAGLLATPAVMAQTTLTLNGASGTSTYTAPQSTTGGTVINQIFGVEYLVVAGGGGGGKNPANNATGRGGGGGAGGLLTNVGGAGLALSPATYMVTVGAGGATGAPAASGGNSSAFGVTANGGGGGGAGAGGNAFSPSNNGQNGGSGGGSATYYGSGSAGLGTVGQGNNGGIGEEGYPEYGSGGGGGAGAVGVNGSFYKGGNGGSGISSSITGSSVTYAGGGGGAVYSTSGNIGLGGTGGGGNGASEGILDNTPVNATSGSSNTGGGGGGGTDSSSGGTGGSGVVIVRYEGTALAGLTTVTTSGTGTISTSSFTGNGTNGTNGQLYQVTSFTIGSSTTSGTFSFNMSGVDLNARLGTTMTGTISGDGGLTFNGPGRLTLAANNTYGGMTTVTGSGSILALASQAASGSSSGITIAPGATLDVSGIAGGFTLASSVDLQSIGGRGTILGNITFSGSSRLAFDPIWPLLVGSGTASFASGFGIGNISGLNASTPDGTYTLLNEVTGGSINLANLANVGPVNAYNLGGGKSAYFEPGGLKVVVVPEPTALAMLGCGAAYGGLWLCRRGRRRRPCPPADGSL